MKRVLPGLIGIALALVASGIALHAQAHKPPKAPKSLRLYIFDCGVIHTTNGDAYSLKKEEMASTEMSIPCILVAHPKGTLMWDNGDIPDRAFPPGGGRATLGVVTQDKPLLPQTGGRRVRAGRHHVSVDVALSRRPRRQRERVRRRHLAGAEGGARPDVLVRADRAVARSRTTAR